MKEERLSLAFFQMSMDTVKVQKANEQFTDHHDVVFEARGLTKVYEMGEVRVHALRGVDLVLYEGELVVLLGASGSGKSTLLNILGGLDTATGGSVIYRGWDLTSAAEKELTEYRRSHVGFVFQFYNLIPSLTALENVAAVTEIAKEPMEPEEALALVGLRDRLHHFPSQLSGGEQQRVAIARAVQTGIAVLEALERANRELGTTTALITHNADIAGMADRVIRLSDGRIVKKERNTRRKSPREMNW
jgi:putative ABC transport system ATP-binding protein